MKKLVFTAFAVGLSLTASVLGQVPNYVPTNGLVGYWPFNGNANDESGNGNNGTVNGATLTADRFGNANKAYSFDGVDDYISVDDNNTLDVPNVTISAWFNAIDYGSVQQQNQGHIVSKRESSGWGSSFQLALENTTFINTIWATYSINGNGWVYYSSSSDLTTQNWIYVTYTHSNNNAKIYVNGILVNTTLISGGLQTNNLPLWFGARPNAGNNSSFFNGSLDDIGIWNRTLTECEIQDLYHAELGSQNINAGSDQTICKGENVTLSATGGSNYQWNNNVVDSQSFSPIQTAIYSVQGTDSLGCIGTDSVLVTVLENSASTINDTAFDTYILNGQTYTQSGTYTQTIPAENGCDSVITLNLTLNFTGIGDQEAESLKIYPNPTTKHITIDNGNFAAMAGYSIKIENNAGQQVFQSAINQQQFYVDLSTWTGNGLYFVHLIDPQNNTVTVRKIVLQ